MINLWQKAKISLGLLFLGLAVSLFLIPDKGPNIGVYNQSTTQHHTYKLGATHGKQQPQVLSSDAFSIGTGLSNRNVRPQYTGFRCDNDNLSALLYELKRYQVGNDIHRHLLKSVSNITSSVQDKLFLILFPQHFFW